jgi:hypothetical protein
VHLVRIELQLIFPVQRRGADEGVDTLALRGLQCLGSTVDVAVGGAGQAAYHRVPDELGNLLDRLEIAVRRDRKAGLDHVDAHGLEHLCDPELLGRGHRAAGRLLAVAQGGVEDDDALGLSGGRLGIGSHWSNS